MKNSGSGKRVLDFNAKYCYSSLYTSDLETMEKKRDRERLLHYVDLHGPEKYFGTLTFSKRLDDVQETLRRRPFLKDNVYNDPVGMSLIFNRKTGNV